MYPIVTVKIRSVGEKLQSIVPRIDSVHSLTQFCQEKRTGAEASEQVETRSTDVLREEHSPVESAKVIGIVRKMICIWCYGLFRGHGRTHMVAGSHW
ncbi:hypothetical protein GCM10025298_06890 [Natronobiforma cellulositropha]